VLHSKLESQGLRIEYSRETYEGLVRAAIFSSAMRPVVIVFLNPTSDATANPVEESPISTERLHFWTEMSFSALTLLCLCV
jgi:hypothetical protein